MFHICKILQILSILLSKCIEKAKHQARGDCDFSQVPGSWAPWRMVEDSFIAFLKHHLCSKHSAGDQGMKFQHPVSSGFLSFTRSSLNPVIISTHGLKPYLRKVSFFGTGWQCLPSLSYTLRLLTKSTCRDMIARGGGSADLALNLGSPLANHVTSWHSHSL